MKGDFSRWNSEPGYNYNGVLHQQGRVLLDSDWNTQTRLTIDWQDKAAGDAIGSAIAAVPSAIPEGFRITGARIDRESGSVELDVRPGRIWANGIPILLQGEESVQRTAEYLYQPDTPAGDGRRDAVVLELWRESLNGFQLPKDLIEPALGGPDTTERLHTAVSFRLLRLGPQGGCDNLGQQLAGIFTDRGRLQVSLRPSGTEEGDCPMAESGGYSGLEHYLYRVEIARLPNDTAPMFKWSRFNGGLTGRGEFNASVQRVFITANQQAIFASGSSQFYLETVEFQPSLGFWQVTYGAKVTLDETGELILPEPGEQHFGHPPAADQTVFFRLWDDIELISDYPAGGGTSIQNHLGNGIYLEFTTDGDSHLMPGDYWTFQVRAGVANEQVLLEDEPPQGIRYHRVPLAILKWSDAEEIGIEQIEDCRHIFRPLTDQATCCSVTVGPRGDVPTINEAIDKLAWWGGDICLLPGIHRCSAEIANRLNIRIRGCGLRTLLLPETTGETILSLRNSWFIHIENTTLATFGGTAVELAGGGYNEIDNNYIFAWRHAISVGPAFSNMSRQELPSRAFHTRITNNTIRMFDRTGGDVAISFSGEQARIQSNNIAVVPVGSIPPPQDIDDWQDPADDCVEPELVEVDIPFVQTYLHLALRQNLGSLLQVRPFRALGGIQLNGSSWRVTVEDNRIYGGDGNGITLGTGSLLPNQSPPAEQPTQHHTVTLRNRFVFGIVKDDKDLLNGISIQLSGPDSHIVVSNEEGLFLIPQSLTGTYSISVLSPGYQIVTVDNERHPLETGRMVTITLRQVETEIIPDDPFSFLYDITLTANKISFTGLCGIGFPAFVRAASQRTTAALLHNVRIHRKLGNPVIGLMIENNQIHNCLRQTPTALLAFGKTRGLGGISLGMCEDLIIRGNRIKDNGRDHRDPVCGIYVGYAARADIGSNRIINNGPLNSGADLNILPGIRGGIVIRKALSVTVAAAAQTIRPEAPEANEPMPANLATIVRAAAALGGYGVRIHDNTVKQPVGHSLHISALGSVAINDNQLITDFVFPETSKPLAGCVYLVNHGQPHYLRKFIGFPMPSGKILFCNNQLRLSVANCWISQAIISADDISYLGNHSDVMEELTPLLFNTLLAALTIRAENNRLQEVISQAKYNRIIQRLFATKSFIHPPPEESSPAKASLFSYGVLMNNTTQNQGNHCILGTSIINEFVGNGNMALTVAEETCQGVNEWLSANARLLLPGFLKLGGYTK